MKYMAIIYGNKELWQSFPPEVAAQAVAEVDAFNRRFRESGELLGACGLGDAMTATRFPGRHLKWHLVVGHPGTGQGGTGQGAHH
ncbi:MAG: YciI family protein [Acidimicrobiales bacterium]|jgi:hypothetical protein